MFTSGVLDCIAWERGKHGHGYGIMRSMSLLPRKGVTPPRFSPSSTGPVLSFLSVIPAEDVEEEVRELYLRVLALRAPYL